MTGTQLYILGYSGSMAKRSSRLSRRAAISLAALPCALWGCAKKPAPNARRTVSLIMKSLANEFFLTMEDGAKQHQRTHAADYELLASGIADERDVAKQIALVDRAIARGVDAIVLAPADSKALVAVCKRALDAQIVVVNIDNKLDAQALGEKSFSIPFVGPNNRKGARLAGDHLAHALRPGDAVAIIEGVASTANGAERKRGFQEAMQTAGMRVVASRSANWETDQAVRLARELLLDHPELRGFLAANDSMAIGIAQALAEQGRAEQVLVVGFDNVSAARKLLQEHRLLATVDQHGDQLATFGIEYALEILSKSAIPADRETPVDLVTS
jgi:ribose transport system substrate-binding protein